MTEVVQDDCVYILDGDCVDEWLDDIEEMDCLEVAEVEHMHIRDVQMQGKNDEDGVLDILRLDVRMM